MWHNNRYEHSNEIEKASLKSFARGNGISENSRLAFGETITSQVNYKKTKNNQKFHSQNEKKDEKRKKRRKTQSYCHIIFESPFLSSTKELKPAIYY